MVRLILALALLGACASLDPFNDVTRAQERLDRRGLSFGVTRVPDQEAFLLQLRFTGVEAGGLDADPMVAALAAAPQGCRVETITAREDGASYRVDYEC